MWVFRKGGMRSGNTFFEGKLGDFALELAISAYEKNKGQNLATELSKICRREDWEKNFVRG